MWRSICLKLLPFCYTSGNIWVRGRRATDVWKEKTHNIREGGGCVWVRGRGATDVYKQMTPKKGGGCVCVSGRDGTDRCVRDTQNKTGGGVCVLKFIYVKSSPV